MALEKSKAKKKYIIIILVAVLALAIASLSLFRIFNKKIQKGTLKESPNKPEEIDPIKSGYIWEGGPDDPKKIIISKIKVDGYIQNVGLDKNRQIVSPGNIFIAGWYVGSSRPGKKGLSIIDGHLNGYKNDGIFFNLDKLSRGDELTVEMGNGTKFNYKVMHVDSVMESKATGYLFNQNPKVTSQLNLITCGGNYDKKARYYDKRVIVSAELVN